MHVLEPSYKTRWVYAEIDLPVEQLQDILQGARAPSGMKASPAGGRVLGDFVWLTCVGPCLVHSKVIEALESIHASGWRAFPCPIETKKKGTVGDYFFLQVTGRCGPLRKELSIPAIKRMPGGMVRRLRGLYFEPQTWDGSDLFVPDRTVWIFTTGRVQSLVAARGFSNCQVAAAEDIEQYT